MLQSIELELTKARELAEQKGHSVLCYLIDMAILEARSVAPSEISQRRDSTERYNIRIAASR
jgi:hypothetical protein